MATQTCTTTQERANMVNQPASSRSGDTNLECRQEAPKSHDNHAVRFAPTVEKILFNNPDDGQRSPVIKAPVQNPGQSEPSPEDLPAPARPRRLSHFHFEPVSLPASRTTSYEGSPHAQPEPLPDMSSHAAYQAIQSPPLTPAGSGGHPDSAEKHSYPSAGATSVPILREPGMITPQQSNSVGEASSGRFSRPVASRPKDDAKHHHHHHHHHRHHQRSSSGVLPATHRKDMFSLGGESIPGSTPASREASPSRAAELYSRPVTSVGDTDSPYAAKNRVKRPAAPKRSVSPRFRFKDRSDTRSSSNPAPAPGHRRPLLHPSHKSTENTIAADTARPSINSATSSFATLKRFFKRKVSGDSKRDPSPSPRKAASSRSLVSAPSRADVNPPFSDDHTLEARYGKIDRVLGSGAGGSVMLMKRDDGRVYAVKEFRQRQPRESRKRYTKKITAEFCVASALHHSNIIETMDIVETKDRWFQVMEYAPFDLFSIVMSGKMSREEVMCSWLQIVSGVTYLHSCGVAHRDLKLDNVVVTKGGIMKIIDFGSAHVFQYPHESAIQYAEGVVGSDPYMAPEVYDANTKAYDPRASDIWSLAIIFCCMTLKRFPWRIPATSQDKSYRLFASPPSAGHDPKHLLLGTKSTPNLAPEGHDGTADGSRGRTAGDESHKRSHSHGANQEKREVISGPWRILRQLPRESRHIIWRMLELDPKRRAKMDEIIRESWVADTMICRETETGEVVHAPGHTHTLIEGTPPPAPEANGKKGAP